LYYSNGFIFLPQDSSLKIGTYVPLTIYPAAFGRTLTRVLGEKESQVMEDDLVHGKATPAGPKLGHSMSS
jgi:hypothetical protein